jgi:AraC family transcriptional regulator, transcriptional activator FtrA
VVHRSGILDAVRNKSDTGRRPHRHRVVLVATPGVPVFELATAFEVFGEDRRDLTPEWYRFEVVTPGDPTTIEGGLVVPPGRGLAALRAADTVVVPACASVHESAPPALLEALRGAHARGARIVSLCSGAFVLAEAGLLDGHRVTTHWMHAEELARRYPRVEVDADVLYVGDGQVWTSAGSAAALDLCLELVRNDLGRAIANEVARRVVMPPHREGGQAQYVRHAPDRATEPVAVTHWARSHLRTATVERMARQAGLSTRTLVRRFHEATGLAPQAWLLRERLGAAQELLESTDLTVESIAERVGLGTATNLRARFRAELGIGPQAYRRAFAAGA